MGKHGPCYHCGVTSTPLWRNGPPEKPVLCNACGSRWRTKGTLANYTPLHARAEPGDIDDYRPSRGQNAIGKRFLKRKYSYDYDHAENGEEETSNRSSSGSALSNQDSARFGGIEVCEMTGLPSPHSYTPLGQCSTKKRTCLIVREKKPSAVEKLTKDLCTILHEQHSASCVSEYCEDDLLFESDRPMVSVEIGHGSVLIRHPSSIGRGEEEESEASSLSVDHKLNAPNVGSLRIKKPFGLRVDREVIKRDKDQLEELPMLAQHDSPSGYIDLQEVKCEKISNGPETIVYGTDDIEQPQDEHLPNDSDGKLMIKSLKTVMNKDCNDTLRNGSSSYSEKLPSDHNHCLELIDLDLEEEEDDLLLLDVPSNTSFPQAELLFPTHTSFPSHNLACP